MKAILFFIAAVFMSINCTSCRTNSDASADSLGKKPPVLVTIFIAEDGGISLGSGLAVSVGNLLTKMKESGVDESHTIVVSANQKSGPESLTKVLDQLNKGQYRKVNVITEM